MNDIAITHRKKNEFKKLLKETDIVKVHQHLEISIDEVRNAYEKKIIPKKIDYAVLLEKNQQFLSPNYKKILTKYLTSEPDSQEQLIAFAKIKKATFKEVQRSMNKGLVWQETAFKITEPDTPARRMAIRSIGKRFKISSKN